MPKQVIMPALGMAQETGTLLRWFKQEGETVQEGEPLMQVATDKVDVEIEAPASGRLASVTAPEGAEIPVGQVIALILAPGEAAPSSARREPEGEVQVQAASTQDGEAGGGFAVSPVAARMAAEHNVDLRQIIPAGSRIQKEDVLAYLENQKSAGQRREDLQEAGRILASPKARRLAAEEGVALASIEGTGPGAAVLAADVLAAAQMATAQPQATLPPVDAAPAVQATVAEPTGVSRMWQVMAERLTQSWTSVPHFYLVREVDASSLITWRQRLQGRVAAVTYTDLLVKVVSTALLEHPGLNARWHEGKIIANAEVNIGLAVAVEDGLLVPVLHDAEQLRLPELTGRRAALVERAQSGKLLPADLQGGTFTISNLGMYGVDAFNAIVNPPQAAILAVGRIADRVVPVEGQPAVRPMMTFTLSCDHRIVDGARAARFLDTLAAFVEDPMQLL